MKKDSAKWVLAIAVFAISVCVHRCMGDGFLFSTMAGVPGQSGSSDGGHSIALFNNPAGVAVDSKGNVFVSDGGNGTIRRIDPLGTTITFAGTAGNSGSRDGLGAAAQFSGLGAIAIGPGDELFVADRGNYTVRKITPEGQVSTWAGMAGIEGTNNGFQSAARFLFISALAADGFGKLYVADGGTSIRVISPEGRVEQFAGQAGVSGAIDGPRLSALFTAITGLAADRQGNVYVADNGNIRRIGADGVVSPLAGGGNPHRTFDAAGSSASFGGNLALAVRSDGSLFAADTDNRVIRAISASGAVATVAGAGRSGAAVVAARCCCWWCCSWWPPRWAATSATRRCSGCRTSAVTARAT